MPNISSEQFTSAFEKYRKPMFVTGGGDLDIPPLYSIDMDVSFLKQIKHYNIKRPRKNNRQADKRSIQHKMR